MAYFSNTQAIEIWKDRWKGATVQSLVAKYGENQFRLYEVWSEKKNEGTLMIAYEQLKNEDPTLAARIKPTRHVETRKVISKRSSDDGQLDFFEKDDDD